MTPAVDDVYLGTNNVFVPSRASRLTFGMWAGTGHYSWNNWCVPTLLHAARHACVTVCVELCLCLTLSLSLTVSLSLCLCLSLFPCAGAGPTTGRATQVTASFT